MHRSAELQGLRAIAVLLVLLFHADWLPGGFIGVDVFYVISGFLITSLILRDIDFSFARFYARRAKRLLPAAFFVLAITSLTFWFLAPASSRMQYAKDLLASTWYLCNYLFAFWQNDYQNLGATPSPLIHYWSLAVEEQFYLIWPLVIYFARRRLRAAVAAIAIASFSLALFLVEFSPILAFYSLPTRAFELAIGAMIAIFDLKLRSLWLGLITILLGAIFFHKGTPFPGLAALIPVVGALLVIASIRAQSKKTFGWNILSYKPLVFLGDWSYSIYLWHWPLLVIPKLYLQRDLSVFEKLTCLVVCIFLSFLTYHFLENPLRNAQITNLRIAFYSLIGSAILSGIAGFFWANSANAIVSNGKNLNLAEVRSQPAIYSDGCQLDKRAVKPKLCIYGSKQSRNSVVLFGDSHAAQWFPALEKWANANDFRLVVMTKSSCPAYALPLRDNGAFKARYCNEFRLNAIKEIKKIQPKILIVSNFEHYPNMSKRDYVLAAKNFPVAHVLIIDTPFPNRDIPDCLASSETNSAKCDTPLPEAIWSNAGSKSSKMKAIFDPIPFLCSDRKCPAQVEGLVAYRDQSHITVAFAEFLSDPMSQFLGKLMAG